MIATGMLADNCGSLSDCLPSARSLLIALAAVLIVVGLVALLAGTGGMAAGPLAALLEGGSLVYATGGVAGSAGAISATLAGQLVTAGAISTAGGVVILEMAGPGPSASGSSSGSGSGSNVPDMPQKPPAPRPSVRSWKLRRIVDDLWRGTSRANRVGDGTTMDAIRNETLTGRPTGGAWHALKGRESINALTNWLKEFGPAATRADRLQARELINELQKALRWTP